jgi:hypothetical protein
MANATKPESTEISERTRRPVSLRQLEANRRNAQYSTGPRTAAGKATSSRNSIKHGAYASISPIDRGALREDPQALEATIDNVLEALRPRNEMERAAALRVATLEVQIGRHHAMDALQLSTSTSRSKVADGEDVFEGLYEVELFGAVAEILRHDRATHTSDDVLVLMIAAAAFDKDFDEIVRIVEPADLAALDHWGDLAYKCLVREPFETSDEIAEMFEAMAHDALESLPDVVEENSAAAAGIFFRLKQGIIEQNSRTLVRLHAALARELDRYHTIRERIDQYQMDFESQPEDQGSLDHETGDW